MDYVIGTTGEGFAGVYHEYNPSVWKGDTGFYKGDARSSIAEDESKTWEQLFVWAHPSYTGGSSMYFSMKSDNSFPPPEDRDYLLELVSVPGGITGAPAVGTVWEVPLGGEILVLELPTFLTTDGLAGYEFAFTMTAVPEPTAFGLVAVGMVPLLLRPRKGR